MSTCSKLAAIFGVAVLAAAQDAGQQGLLHFSSLPADSPVVIVAADYGDQNPVVRGGAMILDLHLALTLRNVSPRRIRGITLSVVAQQLTPGGSGSISVPSLDVAPGETFPVRADMRLLRPVQAGVQPHVMVTLDGVLLDDLSFFGPDRLHSRRTLTVWEMEARRDRGYYKGLLERQGPDGLQKEILAELAQPTEQPQVGLQVVPRGRATNQEPGRDVKLAFLEMPDSPVEPMQGAATVVGNEIRAPRIEVRNRSDRAIRYLEIGWILKDQQGREFFAGSVPADLSLPPGKTSQVLQDSALRFPERSSIDGMTGFVSNVEFNDGALWIPSRKALSDPLLSRVLAPSPEQERLIQIYRTKGLKGLIQELNKF